MNAIETNELSKTFHKMYAVQYLNLHVPEGSIYGFIGENGSGKSTPEKLICGLLVPTAGEINLFSQPHTDARVRFQLGVLIKNPACFPNSTLYQNMMMQALNLNVEKPGREVRRVLELASLVGAAGRKYKECSLGMKQRIGVAQSLLGNPRMLILDEPINGLDADGMRIVRETLVELNQEHVITILISSHILGELSKIAAHYGIIRGGALIREIRAEEISEECRDFVFVKTASNAQAAAALAAKHKEIEPRDGGLRIYDETVSSNVSGYLFQNGIAIDEISFQKIGLEEYYLQTTEKKKGGIKMNAQATAAQYALAETPRFSTRVRSMMRLDFYRLFHTPAFYIILIVAAIIPAMLLTMSGMDPASVSNAAGTVQTVTTAPATEYTNAWQLIESTGGSAASPLDFGGYANINMVFIFAGLLMAIFVSHDYSSGFVKISSPFTLRKRITLLPKQRSAFSAAPA